MALAQPSKARRWAAWLRWGAILLFIAASLEVGYLLAGVLFSVFAVGNLDPSVSFAVQLLFSLSEGFLAAGLFLAFLALDLRWPSEGRYFAAAALITVIGGVGSAVLQGYLYYSLFFMRFNGGVEQYIQTLSYLGITLASLVPVGLGMGVLGFLRMRLGPRPA